MCNDANKLPDPIIVTGTVGFEPVLRQVALKLSVQTPRRTIIYAIDTASSCTGIASVAKGTDLGGTTGLHYAVNGSGYIRDTCTFAAGQKADVAVSDLFYESCPNLPQPKPAGLMDALGPVVATMFAVPIINTTTKVLTYEETRAIFGCGVSSARPIASISDPAGLLCLSADSGPPAILGANLGLPLSTLTPPKCSFGGGTTIAMAQNIAMAGNSALGFITADGLNDDVLALVNPLPFRALGQTQAFYPDSKLSIPDRANVRDGHYTLWGYEHFFANTNAGNLNQAGSDFIGWLTGTKTNSSFDHVGLEGGLGLVPLCAMGVQRSSDGGLLRPYAHPEPCHCAGEAALTKTLPPSCVVCASSSSCTGGRVCRRGFCE